MSYSWTLDWSRKAARYLDSLSAEDRERITQAVQRVKSDPNDRTLDIVRVRGKSSINFYRIRIGGYRVIFQRDDNERALIVRDVGTRGGIYGTRTRE